MVREILDDTYALFTLSGFRKGIAHGAGARTAPPIARLEFLRSRMEELDKVMADIARKPRRRLAARDRLLPYHKVRRATGREIVGSLSRGRVLSEAAEKSRLPATLHGFLPQTIRVTDREHSFDIPEHRQIASCLQAWGAWLTVVADQLTARAQSEEDAELKSGESRWSRRCREMAKKISAHLALDFLSQLTVESGVGLRMSAVFRMDPAYRRFFNLWRDLNRGIAAVFGEFLNMPLARTFDLYELWCFLRLTRAAVIEFGVENADVSELLIGSDSGRGVTIAGPAASVTFGGGWRICFQRQFKEYWLAEGKLGSFSRVMIPDISVFNDELLGGSNNLIVLDAKYRIDRGLNESLSSIHMYRDALVREAASGDVVGVVKAAYLLSPYRSEISDVSDFKAESMPLRLFHPAYRNEFKFGAVSFRPGMPLEEVGIMLRNILADADSSAK